MTDKVIAEIENNKMLSPGGRVIIGLSGGADSVALTHILLSLKKKYSLDLVCAHVNHGIRGEEADRDEQFVKDFCKNNSLELKILRVSVPEESEKTGESEEECARRIRYEFFSSLCDENSVIAVAHNFNDSVETFFINLTRGTGLKGLCGIESVRGNIIRPLISCTRDEIEEYCKQNTLDFVTDSTNLSDEYLRNSVRHNIIPALLKQNPSFYQMMNRVFENLSEDEKYLSSLAGGFMTLYEDGGKLPSDALYSEPLPVRNRIISKMCFNKTGVFPEKKHIDLICKILESKKDGAVQLNKDFYAVNENNLFFIKQKKDSREYWETAVEGFDKAVSTPNGKYIFKKLSSKDLQFVQKNILENAFDCDKISGKVFLRSRREGDFISLSKRGVTKSVRKLFIEEKIPAENRNDVAILSDDNGVFFVDGYGVDKRVEVTSGTENIIVVEKGE